MLSPKDGSTQALQRQPRVLRYAIALQVHTPEKNGRFGLARRFRLLQVNMFRVKLVLEQTPPVAIKTESARALATPKRGEFIGPPLPKGAGVRDVCQQWGQGVRCEVINDGAERLREVLAQ